MKKKLKKPNIKSNYSNKLLLSNCPSNRDECRAAQGCFC